LFDVHVLGFDFDRKRFYSNCRPGVTV
jgi:hypothetical protein